MASSNPGGKAVASEFRPGETVAERYRIRNMAGSGPVSTVYKAEDILSGETVALKLISPATGLDAAAISTYRSDLNVFRNTEHPGLARILDSGDYLGRIYVAMEWLSGPTLRDRLTAAAKLPFESFEKLFTDLAEALAELHAQRLSHRDIHPGNVMWSEEAARWKLMDFGLDRDQRRTRESPDAPYAAPEQIMRQRTTLATDVYSIGAIAFHSLLGRPPIRSGMSPVRVEGPLNGAPPELAPVIETCLQLDPTKRFQNVDALRTATARLIAAGQSAQARPLWEWASAAPGDPEVLTPLFVRVVRALVQLHDSGQQHGELSPKSIRIAGERVLFDTREGAASTPATHATLMIADAKYTAPELVLARKAPDSEAHVRGDMYVLGFVFYEILVGHNEMRRQFADAEQMQTGLAWMHWHADPNAKLRPLAEAVPSCPGGLVEIIERMASKDPAQRPESLESVAEGLDKLTVVLARTQPYALRTATPRPSRKKSRTSAVAAAILVLAVAGFGLNWAFPNQRWVETLRTAWESAKVRLGASGSTRAAGLPPTIQTAAGPMVLVLQGDSKVPSFYVDRTEVANRLYREYCARTGRALPSVDPAYSGDTFPAMNIDRESAALFCKDAGKRLPREDEWERAAGAGETSALLWGNWTLPGLSNLNREGHVGPAPVGTFAADVSPFGMLDAAGNVREWVAADDSSGQTTGFVKGGSFASSTAGLSPSTRTSIPLDRSGVDLSDVGFRCAVDVRGALALPGNSR